MQLSDALWFVLTPFTWAFDAFVRIMSVANALPVYLSLFLVYTVSRLFIRKLVGDAANETKSKKKTKPQKEE